jgi:hypothetical protein
MTEECLVEFVLVVESCVLGLRLLAQMASPQEDWLVNVPLHVFAGSLQGPAQVPLRRRPHWEIEHIRAHLQR